MTSHPNIFFLQSIPMTPAQAIKTQGSALTDHEMSEILEYQQVYFLNAEYRDRKVRGNAMSAHNKGFDDERGDYQIVVHDHLAYR